MPLIRRTAAYIFTAVIFVLQYMPARTGAEDGVYVRDARLSRLRELNALGERDVQVTNAVLATSWPAEMQSEVAGDLHLAIQAHPVDEPLSPAAILYFVKSNDSIPLSLIAYLKRCLPDAELGDKYEFLCAARCLGAQANELRKVVRRELEHPNDVIVVNAASALLRIDSSDMKARGTLLRFLRSEYVDIQWRAADALGYSGANDADTTDRLKRLLSHPDVRVRTTAAVAYWRITKDVKVSIPKLRDALSENDIPLPIGFISPSNRGNSHRAYIAHSLGEMRLQGAPVLDDMLQILEETRIAGDSGANVRDAVAMSALIAIARSGPVSQDEMRRIEEITMRAGSAFLEALLKQIKTQ